MLLTSEFLTPSLFFLVFRFFFEAAMDFLSLTMALSIFMPAEICVGKCCTAGDETSSNQEDAIK